MALSAKLLPRPAGLRAPQCRHVVWRVAAQSSGHVAAGPSRNVTTAAGPAMALSTSTRGEQCTRLPRLSLAHFVPGRGVSTSAKQTGKRSVQSERAASAAHLPTPKAIAAHLDEYVIGQTRAKRALSVGVYNHYLKVAAQERKREGMAAMAAAEEMEAAAVAMRAMAEQEQADMATASVDGNERDQAGRKGSSSETVRDALLTDYVGQAQGSKRWSPEEQKRSISVSKSAPLAPAYFSSAKWPAYAESSRPAVKERKSQRSPSAVTPSRSDDIGMMNQSFAFADLETTMEKSNILMIGPSGSGKSHLVHTLAASLSVPFVHADATPLTSAGYVGEDVESILVRLLEAADWNVERAERGIICIDEIDKLASPAPTRSSGASVAGRDVGGTGVQQALLRILEGTIISIPDKRVAAGAAGSGSRSRFQRAGGSIKPWWSPEMQALNAEQGNTGGSTTPTQMTISGVNAGQTKESVNALMAPRKRQGQPYGPASAAARASGGSPADGSGAIRIDTSNILFVCCGAFAGLQDVIAARSKGASLSAVEADDLTKFGLIPEFVGRLPVMVTLEALTQNDLVRILTEPRNALVSQYQALFSHYNVQLAFTKSALSAFAQQASQLVGASSGARSLRRLLESRLLDAMYEAPGGGVRYALVDKKAALGEREVQVYSRSGRAAWLEASEEDDAEPVKSMSTSARKSTSKASKSSGHGAKTISVTSASAVRRSPTSPPAIGTPRAGVLGRVDETMLRRRARARLTRPSRVGNLRILTSES